MDCNIRVFPRSRSSSPQCHLEADASSRTAKGMGIPPKKGSYACCAVTREVAPIPPAGFRVKIPV